MAASQSIPIIFHISVKFICGNNPIPNWFYLHFIYLHHCMLLTSILLLHIECPEAIIMYSFSYWRCLHVIVFFSSFKSWYIRWNKQIKVTRELEFQNKHFHLTPTGINQAQHGEVLGEMEMYIHEFFTWGVVQASCHDHAKGNIIIEERLSLMEKGLDWSQSRIGCSAKGKLLLHFWNWTRRFKLKFK